MIRSMPLGKSVANSLFTKSRKFQCLERPIKPRVDYATHFCMLTIAISSTHLSGGRIAEICNKAGICRGHIAHS